MKTIQIWCGDTHVDLYKKYERCMDMVRDMMLPNYERIFIKREGNTHPIITTDKMRIMVAAENPDMLYADCDITFNEKPVFKDGGDVPYFGKARGVVNHCLFYVNRNSDFFKNILKEKESRGIEDVFGWPMKIIRTKNVNIIDDKIFNHPQFSTSAGKIYPAAEM